MSAMHGEFRVSSRQLGVECLPPPDGRIDQVG